MKMNPISTKNSNYKESTNDVKLEICKNNEEYPLKKNKLKVKDIPHLNFKNKLHNSSNMKKKLKKLIL